ncbi:MAG TPA: hypothetical protein VN214_00495 [Pseudomonas sp.]|nr:hypothetical protein [Pseudomonas sp.]
MKDLSVFDAAIAPHRQTGRSGKGRKRPTRPRKKLDCAECGADCHRFQGKRPTSFEVLDYANRLTVDKYSEKLAVKAKSSVAINRRWPLY